MLLTSLIEGILSLPVRKSGRGYFQRKDDDSTSSVVKKLKKEIADLPQHYNLVLHLSSFSLEFLYKLFFQTMLATNQFHANTKYNNLLFYNRKY